MGTARSCRPRCRCPRAARSLATRRRRAILVATFLDLKARLTDAVLNMANKLIGGLFAKARNATLRRYAASAGDVGRLMRLFHRTIEALAAAEESDHDAFEVVDQAVGWAELLRVRSEVEGLASLAEEDPCGVPPIVGEPCASSRQI